MTFLFSEEASARSSVNRGQAPMLTTNTLRLRRLRTHKKGKHHEIRNARQYRSPGFETLLRNHDIRGRRGMFKAISFVGQAEADEVRYIGCSNWQA